MDPEIIIEGVTCQHPFGKGIHIVIPETGEMLWILLNIFNVSQRFKNDINMLEKISRDTDKNVCKAVVYPCITQENGDEYYCAADINVSKSVYKVMFIMIEHQCLEKGYQVLKELPSAFKAQR